MTDMVARAERDIEGQVCGSEEGIEIGRECRYEKLMESLRE